jgi:hypothetical protein
MLLLPLIAGCIHRSPEDRVLAAFRETGLANARVADVADTTAAKCTALTAHVKYISGDTAVVGLFQDCATPAPTPPKGQNRISANAIRFETDYLVVRRKGQWKVVKPIGAGAMIAS